MQSHSRLINVYMAVQPIESKCCSSQDRTGPGYRIRRSCVVLDLGFGVWGLGFQVLVSMSGFWISGFGFRVLGFGFRISGSSIWHVARDFFGGGRELIDDIIQGLSYNRFFP